MSIAVLGGTFDPIHSGHLRAAEIVAEAFTIDEVHFVPAFSPPHKPLGGITSAFHRFAMVAIAVEPFEKFRVSSIEVDSLEPRYTADTLGLMRQLYPDSPLLFIIGTDLYSDIDQWKDHEKILDRVSVAVVNRPGFPIREDLRPVEVVRARPAAPLSATPRVYFLDSLEEDISSTDLRDRLRDPQSVAGLIPAAVLGYIVRNQLYV